MLPKTPFVLLIAIIYSDYTCRISGNVIPTNKNRGTLQKYILDVPRQANVPVSAVLTRPSSRALNCFWKINNNCNGFESNDIGRIIGPIGFPQQGAVDGQISSAGSQLYSILDQYGANRWKPGLLKLNPHNETHYISEITWTINDKTSIVDVITVYLSNGNYSDNGPLRRSMLNLACSYRNTNGNPRDSYHVRVSCYIKANLVKDLVREGKGVLLSTLSLAGQDGSFYQIADISVQEPMHVDTFHGFVSDPPSRAKLCQLRVNRGCGSVIYEPQSLEGFQGFPDHPFSPPDGKIASADNPRFREMDDYGTKRWVTVEFPEVRCYNKTHVHFNLSWYFTAPHSSDNIRVYISNENFSSAEPLSRRHLDLTPICSMDLNGEYPPTELTLLCPISWEKYRQLQQFKELLLLAVWNIYDTSNAFYQVTDVDRISDATFANVWNTCRQ